MPEVRLLSKRQQYEGKYISESHSLLLLLLPRVGPWLQNIKKKWQDGAQTARVSYTRSG